MFLKRKVQIFLWGIFYGLFASCSAQQQKANSQFVSSSLKYFYRNYFPVGVAVAPRNLVGDEANLIKQQFNSLTAENAMKMTSLQPKEGVFNWAAADSIIDFAIKNKMKVRGHTLCWHKQTPDWFFVGPNGERASKELLLKRLKTHIQAVMTRYKSKVHAWDVVNEAVDDEPKNYLRRSKWYEIAGEDYIAKAFEYAHEADPAAQLFYNDYNAERSDKGENIYRLLKSLKEKGITVNGIGLQSHWSIFSPSKLELETAIEKFSSLGLKIHITELDISIYPWEPNERAKRVDEVETYTAALEQKQAEKYEMVFGVFRKYKNVIHNVTFWNVSDRYTWLDYFPVDGRKDYPLLFDTNLHPKKAYWKVINFKDK